MWRTRQVVLSSGFYHPSGGKDVQVNEDVMKRAYEWLDRAITYEKKGNKGLSVKSLDRACHLELVALGFAKEEPVAKEKKNLPM
jgi:hypothetical protein